MMAGIDPELCDGYIVLAVHHLGQAGEHGGNHEVVIVTDLNDYLRSMDAVYHLAHDATVGEVLADCSHLGRENPVYSDILRDSGFRIWRAIGKWFG
jgi:hypothetical protein